MPNFNDDDVLLKWEITENGLWVDCYSHFNSMMESEIKPNKAVMIATVGFLG